MKCARVVEDWDVHRHKTDVCQGNGDREVRNDIPDSTAYGTALPINAYLGSSRVNWVIMISPRSANSVRLTSENVSAIARARLEAHCDANRHSAKNVRAYKQRPLCAAGPYGAINGWRCPRPNTSWYADPANGARLFCMRGQSTLQLTACCPARAGPSPGRAHPSSHCAPDGTRSLP